jgi:methyl-accepting chemotaxis protein
MKRMSLDLKLIAGGIVAVMVPLLIVGIFAAVKASGALEAAAKDRAMNSAVGLADVVNGILRVEMKVVGEIARSDDAVKAAVNGDPAALNIRLNDLIEKNGKDYESIFVTDVNGLAVADGNKGAFNGLNFADRGYFQKAKEGKSSVGSVVRSKQSGNPVSAICAPIMKDGTFVGAVVLGLKIDYFSDKVTAKVGETGYGFMTDSKGLIIAHPKKEYILEKDLSKEAGMQAIMSKMLSGQSGSESYVFTGVSKIAGFAPVELTGWAVGITQNAEDFLAAARSIRNFILITGLLFLVLTIAGVAFFARSVSVPIRNAVVEMGEAANQVAAASSQVAAASQTLAEGSSEQASSLEETSSSLEEMSSMTKQNAANAAHADGLMKQANQVIQKANDAMKGLTRSMNQITAASEETSKIIRTIDEIAFQTNLLALNAAVEAARAGEAGAGFAVVAEEVRNLAIRAADAAKNTAGLIEGTVKKVKEGSELVENTNDAFSEVSISTTKVAELVGEISAASQEQSQGIDQINRAVAEMDKVTQSTAASAEESASASEEMNAQAEQMKQISRTLVGIIGGAGIEDSDTGRKPAGVRRRIGSATSPNIAARTKGREIAASTVRKRETRPEFVIPMDDGQFKDF